VTVDTPTWRLSGTHAMACNCDYGCPCAFNARPTYGPCEAVVAVSVDEGSYGDVDLAGLQWVGVGAWPGPLHEGNGRAVIYLPPGLPDDRRDAVEALATGRAGGPWSILVGTATAGVDVREAAFEYVAAGPATTIRVGREVELAYAPIRNPVTGAEHRVSTLLHTGLLTNRQDQYASNVNRVAVDGIRWDVSERAAIEMPISWSGP
jgi:hypothetical protein